MASECTSAIILDTEYFKTTEAILEHNPMITSIVCPQLDYSTFKKMKGAHQKKQLGKTVSVVYSTMGDLISPLMTELCIPSSKVIVWHDAMATWENKTKQNTAIKDDVRLIFKTFEQSPSDNMILAITTSTRSHVTGERMHLGGNRDVVVADIVDMAFECNVRIQICDMFAYPRMFFVAIRVSKLHPLSTENRGVSSNPVKRKKVEIPTLRTDGVRVKALWNDGMWYTGTLKKYNGVKGTRDDVTFYIRYDIKPRGFGRHNCYYIGKPDVATIQLI